MITNISNTYLLGGIASIAPSAAEIAKVPQESPKESKDPESQAESAAESKKYDTFNYSIEDLKKQVENAHKQAEATGDAFSALGKCLRIAMHIIAGDIVPNADDKFLFENNPKLHEQAWLLRRMKEDPDEWESVLDEDDTKDPEAEPSEIEAPDIAAPSAPEIAVPEISEPQMDFSA